MRSLNFKTIWRRQEHDSDIAGSKRARSINASNPIFVHSSFRTSSTWLWQAFRRAPGTIAYYEVFHEQLAGMLADDIGLHRHDAWSSNHPPGEPYFLEFAPLINPGGGVLGYSKEFAFTRFIPTRGLNGSLDAELVAYVDKLLDHARCENRIPVLSCCRSLGRIRALKRDFQGWHIFLCRNLFQQWMSYLSLHQQGNNYFINTVAETLRSNSHDPFVAKLNARFLKRPPEGKSSIGDFFDIEAAFCAFAGLHIYLSMFAAEAADQIIDVNALARNPGLIQNTEAELFHHTKLRIRLGDVKEAVEYAEVMGRYVPDRLEQRLDELYQLSCRHLSSFIGPRTRAFGKKYVSDAVAEASTFERFSIGFQRNFERNLALMRELIESLKGSDAGHPEVEQISEKLQSRIGKDLLLRSA